eukprot:s1074_g4.t1
MPRVSDMMAAKWQAVEKSGETPGPGLRFSEATVVEVPADNVVLIDCCSNAADPWFDWSLLEKAEAQEAQARSKSAPPRRPERTTSPMCAETKRSKGDSRCARSEVRWTSGDFIGTPSKHAASPPVAAPHSPTSASGSGSEKQHQGAGETFRAWLEQKPAMMRLSPFRCETGVAWDFPLAKSEKRELLLQHFAATERIAEEQAMQAEHEVELAWREERRHRQSLVSAKAAISRMRKKGRRMSLGA